MKINTEDAKELNRLFHECGYTFQMCRIGESTDAGRDMRLELEKPYNELAKKWDQVFASLEENGRAALLRAAMELPEVQALVEASRRLYDICYWLTRDQIAKLGDEAMISAGYGLAYDQMADNPGRVNLKWARDALAPFDVEK